MNSEAEHFAEMRKRMVETQLRERGIKDSRVLAAVARVPREEFVPPELREEAYDDRPLPIGFGQTISQPFTVAFMLEALKLTGSEKVLEIGTGSGYAAAVLSQLSQVVYTVERISELGHAAQDRLRRMSYDNVYVQVDDGSVGLPDYAPFDAIVVTAAAEVLPPPLQKQLAIHGRMVIPLGDAFSQSLYRLTNTGERFVSEDLGAFRFVPLIGRHGREHRSPKE